MGWVPHLDQFLCSGRGKALHCALWAVGFSTHGMAVEGPCLQPYQLGEGGFPTEIKGKLGIIGKFVDSQASKNYLGGLYF